MIGAVRKLLGRADPGPVREPAIPRGRRVYAVGDIHGRCDLFLEMISIIERDNASRERAATVVILLGDLIDRGPDSASVFTAARAWRQHRDVRVICGNHEEAFFESFTDVEVFSRFLEFGGRETICSYLSDERGFAEASLDDAHRIMLEEVPQKDIEFVASMEKFIVIGDYAFVHAGILPQTPMVDQRAKDLRWIREPFLSFREDHEYFVIHGHTITGEPDLRSNRIGIDTGAYMSGCLTAIGLEGTSRWLLQAYEAGSGIRSSVSPLP